MNVLFHGRHVLNSNFQETYLRSILGKKAQDDCLRYQNKKPVSNDTLDTLIIPLTSANLDTSPYSPVTSSIRLRTLDRFAKTLEDSLGIKTKIFEIPHFPTCPDFISHVQNEIFFQTEGSLVIDTTNSVAVCSSQKVTELFSNSGYSVLAGEIDPYFGALNPIPPFEILQKVVSSPNWLNDEFLTSVIHPATISVWKSHPEVVTRLKRLSTDPLLTEQGDLTENRDYNTYAMGMSNPAILEAKYKDIQAHILEGLIVDEGCADGALLARISKDYRDSRLLGVEITGNFIERCRTLQELGGFGTSYVYFHQANLLFPVLSPNQVDTTICNSTTHELYSYAGGEKTLTNYLSEKFAQTRQGGRLIIRDVVGPQNSTETIYLELPHAVGENVYQICDSKIKLKTHLESLSLYGRFLRFANDYLPHNIEYCEVELEGKKLIQTSLKNAHEFMTKFMYTDNYESEMHEEFGFWSPNVWKTKLEKTGFNVIHLNAYRSDYIQREFWKDISLYTLTDAGLKKQENPITNIVIVGEKR
jgi:hypothetical protein